MNSNALKIAYGSPQLLLKMSGLEIPCFILNDKKHVLPISGIHKLFGYEGKSEIWLLNILNTISKFTKIQKELLQAYESPIKIETNHSKAHKEIIGLIDSNLFIETCKTFVEAKNNGLLGANLIKISKTAEAILKHTKDQNIDDLIDIATGYTIFKEHVKHSLQKYMQTQLEDDVALWLRTFPDEFYAVIFEIHNYNWHTVKAKPENLGKIFYDIIFSRIPSELLADLNANQPKRAYKRINNKPQNNEHAELKKYLDNLIALLKTSGNNWFIFLQLLNRNYPIQNYYSKKLRFETSTSKKESLSAFNSRLKKLT
ncbi:P63C domain-containing protein [Flavobacterium sp.]|uniref:P63C domain-containing protein n=1 Tax=Flavobacterium sp. TaxID=239 RepID=UPI00286B973A|nr:P63C domain-containing protein [Flavobacterium sp.]